MKGYKSLIFRILCNNFTGWIISILFFNRIPTIRCLPFRFKINPRCVNKKQIASIFWGFYESAEIRLVEKYLDGTRDVLELGGSVGVVSSHIGSRLHPGKRLIIVEANPNLISEITMNVALYLKSGASASVENCAISYVQDSVSLVITDNNTETRVRKGEPARGSEVMIEAKTVEAIALANGLNDFAMVCDIEGSEIEILLNDKNALKKCSQLIIELHQTSHQSLDYSVNDLAGLIEDGHQFNLVEHQGPVYYFERSRKLVK